MKVLVVVSLNTDKYIQTIGQLPNCYLRSCTAEVTGNYDKITNSMKRQAISEYWIKAGGTGGYKRDEKLDINMFNFSLV